MPCEDLPGAKSEPAARLFSALPSTHKPTAASQRDVSFDEPAESEQYVQPPFSQNALTSVLVAAASWRGSVC